MIRTKNLGPVLAAIAAITTFLPAMADTTMSTTTITTTSRPVVLQGSAMTAPTIVVTGYSGKSVTTPSRFPIVLAKFTATNGITIFYPCAREDLSIRRDDLFARILIEHLPALLVTSSTVWPVLTLKKPRLLATLRAEPTTSTLKIHMLTMMNWLKTFRPAPTSTTSSWPVIILTESSKSNQPV